MGEMVQRAKPFWRRMFCRHDFRFWRNIYGDEIILSGWKRSDWKCAKCGQLQLRDYLVDKAREALTGGRS